MAIKKRKINPRRIKKRRTYSFREIADILGVHQRTVQIWKKEGLKVLEPTKPFLVMGSDLQEFLKDRAKKRKNPLQIGECYCPKCKCSRKSKVPLQAQLTGRSLGKIFKQVLLKGVCETCGRPMILFSSDRKVAEMIKAGVPITEPHRVITGSDESSTKTDIREVKENG